MNKLKLALTMFILMLLVSCASTDLSPVNLAKKKIIHGVYTAQIGEKPNWGSFTLEVPQASDEYEFSSLQMKEEFGADLLT